MFDDGTGKLVNYIEITYDGQFVIADAIVDEDYIPLHYDYYAWFRWYNNYDNASEIRRYIEAKK